MKNSPEDCHITNRWLKFFKKWHRWPGVIMGLLFILWAVSGIVMNHRELLSGFDINRNYLPKEHRYVNWNNAAVKSGLMIGNDSLLVYGNIGIWLTDSSLTKFKNFNAGFPGGIDNRKISSMLVTGKGNLYAGTLFGLYRFDPLRGLWVKLNIPLKDERIQCLVEKGNEVMILTRSEFLAAVDDPTDFRATALHLPPPEGYDNKAGFFRTIWVIHSGEIYGTAGRLIVDVLALIVILLAITGALHFSMPYALRRLKRKKKSLQAASATKRFSAKWHKKAGIWIAIFLLINTVTGMFLRPPLLIAIANARVGKIPFSVLDTSNPWEDKLRTVIYDDDINGFIFGTTDGLFFSREDFSSEMQSLPGQPPISVMGINVFEKTGPGKYLVGSFNGLYDWYLGDSNPRDGVPVNHLTGRPAESINPGSKPFGNEMVSGYLVVGSEKEVWFDYNRGAMFLNSNEIPPVIPSEIIDASPMSWWNVALEIHTGRIFKPLIGDFYILIIPLMGIFGTIIVVTGIIIWTKLYVRKNR
jgi:hypothetical protein